MNLDTIPFVQAKYWSAAANTPKLIVLHSMECPLESGRAEQVARWFAGPTSPRASAHYMVDPNSVWCGVKPPNVAWHVGAANWYSGAGSIGIEQSGYAYQSDWSAAGDPSKQMDLVISLVAALCDRYQIPRVWLGVDGLRAGAAGISTHGLCSAAGIGTDHTDPGPDWPKDEFIRRLTGVKQRTKQLMQMVTKQDGGIVQFGFFQGQLAHRWQERPNGNWAAWVALNDRQPFGADGVTAAQNKDGRFEICIWNSVTNQVAYRTQNFNGTWRAWVV
jgi:N-acetyl-anhydromuramyl-L-alanine amidase AmpD